MKKNFIVATTWIEVNGGKSGEITILEVRRTKADNKFEALGKVVSKLNTATQRLASFSTEEYLDIKEVK